MLFSRGRLAHNKRHLVHQLEQTLIDDVVPEKALLNVWDVQEFHKRNLANLELLQLLYAYTTKVANETNDAHSTVQHVLNVCPLASRDRHFG